MFGNDVTELNLLYAENQNCVESVCLIYSRHSSDIFGKNYIILYYFTYDLTYNIFHAVQFYRYTTI